MTAPAANQLEGSGRMVDRTLRRVEETARALRQRLLARELGRTLPREHWEPAAASEPGITAEDLRAHAAKARRDPVG